MPNHTQTYNCRSSPFQDAASASASTWVVLLLVSSSPQEDRLSGLEIQPISSCSSASTTQRQYQMESGSSLEVVLGGGLVVVHLLSAEDESLLDGWDAFLFFDAFLYLLDLWNDMR